MLLTKLSQFLSKYTTPVVLLFAAAAFIYAPSFAWVKGETQTIILGVIMFAMGLTLSPKDFAILAKRPGDILIGTLAQFTIMPLIAFTLVHLGLPKGIAIGLLLVGTCPGGVSSNIMSFLCKGDVAFSVGMTAVNTLLAPVLTPILMKVLAGEIVEVNAWGLFKTILCVTIFPVIGGFVLNYLLNKKQSFQMVRSWMPGVAVLGLGAIVGGVISLLGSKFFSSGAMIFLCVFLHNSLGYVAGYAIGKIARMSKAKKRTISIEVGMQNAGLATGLASQHFPAYPEAAVAAAISCVWHSISGTILAGIFILMDHHAEKKMQKDKDRILNAVKS